MGRDLWVLKALTPLPRLWLRSPAPGSLASKTAQARVVEPARRARAHAGSPSPAPRGGRGIRPGACRPGPPRPAPARPPPRPRASPTGSARPGPRPVQARGRPRPGEASSGLPRPTRFSTPEGPSLTWTRAGGPRAAPRWARGGGAALTAPLSLASGGGGSGSGYGDGGGGSSSSARTARSGPRPGHAPSARAPIGRLSPRRASHWPAWLSPRSGARGGGGISVRRCLRRGRWQVRPGWPAMAAVRSRWRPDRGSRPKTAVEEPRTLWSACCVPAAVCPVPGLHRRKR